MSRPRKRMKLPPPDVLKKQSEVRITLTFEEAAQLISYELVQPDDFAGRVMQVASSDLDALTELATNVELEDFVRLLQGLRTRLDLAGRIHEALKKVGAA